MNYLNISFSFVSDPLSLFFAAVIILVSVPSALYSLDYMKGEYSTRRQAYGWLLLVVFVAAMLLVVTAGNGFLFLIAWELMSLVSYFLVVFDTGRQESVKAGTIYIVMTHLGTVFIAAALFTLFRYAHSFDFAALKQAGDAMTPGTKGLLFIFLLIGFGTKAGVVPLHVWLPYAHPRAPSPISSMMSGVMIKTAIYGFVRFVITILGAGDIWWGQVVLIFGSISCLVGIMYALTENDLKKLLAFSSVENIGIILLGVGASMVFLKTGMPFAAVLALTASLYHVINHAVFKSLLFLCAGSVQKSCGTRDMEKLGGLIKAMPWTAAMFLIGSMAISALPPFNGFVSEWLTFQALFAGIMQGAVGMRVLMAIYAAVLALTGGLAAACFVKAFGITFLALPRSEDARKANEAPRSMLYAMATMAAFAVLLGLAAGPVTKLISEVALFTTGAKGGNFSLTLNNFVLMPQFRGAAFLSPALIALVLLGGGAFTFLMVYLVGGRKKATRGRTWGCGYYELDSKAEYTATAFSKPFRVAFTFFYRPYRKTEEIKESLYHVKKINYETFITPVFRRYLYRSILERAFGTARFVSRLQSGSIHLYVGYIFITLVLLAVFLNRF